MFEIFSEPLLSLLQQISNPDGDGGKLTSEKLLEAFQRQDVSDAIVFFLRLLTAAQIRSDPTAYCPYLQHPEHDKPVSLDEFCKMFVEIMGTEADHVQVSALSRILNISVDIAYLDGKSRDGHVRFVLSGPQDTERESDPLQLLYRPGHYDILVKSGKGKQRAEWS